MNGDRDTGDLARLRQGLYRFFAVALAPPEPARIDRLGSAADLLEDLGVDTLAFAQPWREMRGALATLPPFEELAVQYVSLFETAGIQREALCPPVESYYVASARAGGPALVTADLEREYRRLGIKLADGLGHGLDHISPQLELMALLCAEEATAGESGDLESVAAWNQEQQKFADDHLSRWVPRFTARIRENAPLGFYRALVLTLEAFLDHDRELLRLLGRRERTTRA